MGLGDRSILELQPQDDYASVRHRLSWLDGGRVALVLPWDLHFPSSQLEFRLLRREAERRQLEIAIICTDPQRRQWARSSGFPAFSSIGQARKAELWDSAPPVRVDPPPHHWWEEEVDLTPRSVRPRPPWFNWGKRGLRIIIFVLAILVVAGSVYVIVPSAVVTLVPAGRDFATVVPVSVDPEIEKVDLSVEGEPGGIVPARRVGVKVQGYAEVETTGTANVPAGRAKGEVLFTNLLTQHYVVPAGTVVRTSSTSYPIRFRTTTGVAIPPGGQATAPIEALDKGVGNIGAFRINQVEGVAASAVRVTNPEPTSGAEPTEVRVVTQADYDRVRKQLNQQLLDQANEEMGSLLEPTEFIPRQSLRIEAAPKKAYTHFVAEQAGTLGLNMSLLVSGLAVDADNAEAVAYSALSQRLPPEYVLVDARFELGEISEEENGRLMFPVTARGYAAAELDTQAAVARIRGRPVGEAQARLRTGLPLAEDPRITVWPEWLGRLPLLPMRISVHVAPHSHAVSQVPSATG